MSTIVLSHKAAKLMKLCDLEGFKRLHGLTHEEMQALLNAPDPRTKFVSGDANPAMASVAALAGRVRKGKFFDELSSPTYARSLLSG